MEPTSTTNGRYDERIKKIRVLFVADVDTKSATALTESFLRQGPKFDAVVVCGPFHSDTARSLEENGVSQREVDAVATGDISTSLAQLENIVCRVMYLASETDPKEVRDMQLRLTPNSINIHARELILVEGLNISGLTEVDEMLDDKEEPVQDSGDDPIPPDEFGQALVEKSTSSDIIDKLLGELAKRREDTSIFLLNHKYMHTLNTFIFHKSETIAEAGVALCVVPRYDEVTARIPAKIGSTTFLVLKSLRDGHYGVAEFEPPEESVGTATTAPWRLTSVSSHELDK